MKVSLIYTACNQGDWVRHTLPMAVGSLAGIDHEIIVVDDQSVDGCCHNLETRCLIIRTEQRVGVSAARRIGATKAQGDVIIFSDPHCDYPGDALSRLAHLAWLNRAIVEPPTKSRAKSSRVAYGGRLEKSDRGLVVRTSRDRADQWPALINTIYAVRRDVYEAFGGWPELPGCWGYSEQAMTLLAWRCGVPIIVADTDICIHHAYQVNRRLPYHTSTRERAINAHYVHAAFLPKSYEKHWKQLLNERFGYVAECEQALKSRDFRRLREHIARHETKAIREETIVQSIGGLGNDSRPTDTALVEQQRPRALELRHSGGRPRLRRSYEWLVDVIPGCLRGRRVLDVGTHDGLGCTYLRALGARVVEGVELVPEMAAEAQRLGRPVRNGDLRQLSDPDATWDVVTCVHALEHVPDPERALAELVRVLRPRGWLLIVVPREDVPQQQWAHNCAFPDSRALRSLVAANSQLVATSMRVKIVKYSDSELEIRLAAKKK